MKAFFFTRHVREKILLVAFTALIAAVWLSAWSDRLARFWREQRRTSIELNNQQAYLNERSRIEEDARKAVQHLDPARTFDAARLVGELGTIANSAGLTNTSSESPRTDQTSEFAVNSVQFSVRRAELGALLRFYEEVSKRAPYITIEQLTLQADRANPALLNASIRVSSVEIVRAQ